MDGRFDDLLLGLAQKHRGIEDLLYTTMSFLERRTDLFHVKESDEEKKGFKEGQAEAMLHKQFNHFQASYLSRAQPHLLAAPRSSRSASSSGAAAGSGDGAAAAEAAGDAGETGAAPDGGATAGSGEACAGGEGGASDAAAAPRLPGKDHVPEGVNASPLDGGDAGQWEREKQKADGFFWVQTVQEVTLEIDVEKCTARDIKVDLMPRKICVKRKGAVVLEGKLHDKINCEESTWHLDDSKQVVLSLEKIKPIYWASFFEGGGSASQVPA